MIEHNKLVRDNIPTIIKKDNKMPITHSADEKEYNQKLRNKLQEKVNEFLDKENIEELIDILEVIHTITRDMFNITPKELEQLRKEKVLISGSFKKRIILEKII